MSTGNESGRIPVTQQLTHASYVNYLFCFGLSNLNPNLTVGFSAFSSCTRTLQTTTIFIMVSGICEAEGAYSLFGLYNREEVDVTRTQNMFGLQLVSSWFLQHFVVVCLVVHGYRVVIFRGVSDLFLSL